MQIAMPEEPIIEYFVVEDEFYILDEVFDALFEQVEKEIREQINGVALIIPYKYL